MNFNTILIFSIIYLKFVHLFEIIKKILSLYRKKESLPCSYVYHNNRAAPSMAMHLDCICKKNWLRNITFNLKYHSPTILSY